MKIALINENSQAAKNGIIEAALKKVVEPMGHEVVNYGMYAADDAAQLTYVQCGILAAILLNSGAADYVITGCGTGEGAMLALNSFPGVICGHVEDPVDAYTFAHVNDGNAVAMPFAKGFGWGGELNLEYCFEMCALGRGFITAPFCSTRTATLSCSRTSSPSPPLRSCAASCPARASTPPRQSCAASRC